jgi:hypothetical protein
MAGQEYAYCCFQQPCSEEVLSGSMLNVLDMHDCMLKTLADRQLTSNDTNLHTLLQG